MVIEDDPWGLGSTNNEITILED